MSASRKPPGPPDMSGLQDDWKRMSGLRRAEQAAEPPAASVPQEQPAPRKAPSRTRAATAEPAKAPTMSRRSWYAEQDAVEALAAAVDEVHFATRVPKHTIVSELFRLAAAAAPKVEKRLTK